MNVLYIHQYFATPNGSTGTRSYEFARRWAANGHKVTMLTTTAQLTAGDLENAKGRFFKRFTIQNIEVLAMSIPYRQQMGIVARCLSFLGFVIASLMAILFIKGVNVVYATSTPLTVGIPALVAKWCRRIPFVFEVRDQWPEAPIEMGIIKNKIIIKILLWLERTIYEQSSAIIALSQGMAEGVRKVLTEDKEIRVIPNSSDTDTFRPDIDGTAVRREYGWDDKFVLLHAGAMGRVNCLDFVIDAAVRLRDNPKVLFVLLGEGGRKAALQSRVKELGLTNVQFLPALPRQQLPEFYASVDIGLMVIGNFPIIQHNSANKFFDSLSAGKPVLLNYSGWQRKVLEGNSAGFGCELCNLDEFVEKVLYFNSHRQQVEQMSQNARRVAIEEFDRDLLASQALEVLELVVER